MDCQQARTLLHPYVDGELDLVTSLETEHHLAQCPACRFELASLQALTAAIKDAALYREAPDRLHKVARDAVRAARRRERRQSFVLTRLAWGGVGALAAAVIIAIVIKGILPLSSPNGDLLARALLDDHLRSLVPNHLTDVLSSNQHTVKPWFDGRLNFTPPVEDLTAKGFPLIGGRIDYLDNHPVAAVVYRRRLHVINLFVWPMPHTADTPTESETVAGYNIVHWSKSRMAYWAVSSLGPAELQQFAQLLRK